MAKPGSNEQDAEESKSGSKITRTEWGLVIGALLTIDAVQFGLDMAFGIGFFVNPFIDILIALAWPFYLRLRGVNLNTLKIIVNIAALFFEITPLGAMPLWFLDGIIMFLIVKIEEKLKKVPVVGKLVDKAEKAAVVAAALAAAPETGGASVAAAGAVEGGAAATEAGSAAGSAVAGGTTSGEGVAQTAGDTTGNEGAQTEPTTPQSGPTSQSEANETAGTERDEPNSDDRSPFPDDYADAAGQENDARDQERQENSGAEEDALDEDDEEDEGDDATHELSDEEADSLGEQSDNQQKEREQQDQESDPEGEDSKKTKPDNQSKKPAEQKRSRSNFFDNLNKSKKKPAESPATAGGQRPTSPRAGGNGGPAIDAVGVISPIPLGRFKTRPEDNS